MSLNRTEDLLRAVFPAMTGASVNGRRPTRRSLHGGESDQLLTLEVTGGWAFLRAAPAQTGAKTALDVLCSQSAWPGNAKHVPLQAPPILRADVPLLMDSAASRAWVTRQLRIAREGMHAAAGETSPADAWAAHAPAREDPDALACACAAGGWSAAVKSDGSVRIDLVVRGAPRSVSLQASAAGVRASIALASDMVGRASDSGLSALSAFLLRAAGALCWVRAFASRDDEQLSSVGFECIVAAPPDEHALLTAIDALVAACEFCGREAEMLLEHPGIAASYMDYALGPDRSAEDGRISIDAAALRAASPSLAARAAVA